MRGKRALLFISISSILAIAAACGGDDNGGGGTTDAGSNDASTSDVFVGDSGGGSDAAALQANANDLDVYFLQTATLDATASTPSGATFSWQLATAPAGSAITTASLANATTATPSFLPDMLGTYVFTLKVTSGGVSATKNVNVRVFAGKLFVAHDLEESDGGELSDVLYAPTVGNDGGAATVSCETSYIQQFSASGGGTENSPLALEGLTVGLDSREGAPADDAKVAFGFREIAGDGGFTNYLATGTSSSRCDTIKKLDPFVNGGDVPEGVRISPNGDRVAFIRQNGSTIDVATIGLDGSNLRVLGSLYRMSDGGVGTSPAFSFLKRRVQWTDETHVAWLAESTDLIGDFSIVVATDATTPNVTDYMDCATTNTTNTGQVNVSQFEILPSGVVLVNGAITEVDAGSSGIYALRPNVSTKQCDLLGQIGVGASTFARSPDGARIAFAMYDSDAGIQALYTAPLDGGQPVEVRPSDAGVAALTGFGPLWVQGGAALAYETSGSAVIDGGSTLNAAVVPVQGGSSAPVVFSASNQDLFVLPTNGSACSVGRAAAGAPLFGMLASLGLLVMRRKRKQRPGAS